MTPLTDLGKPKWKPSRKGSGLQIPPKTLLMQGLTGLWKKLTSTLRGGSTYRCGISRREPESKAQRLRAPTVLAEDMNSVPSTYMAAHNHLCNCNSKGSDFSLSFLRYMVHAQECKQTLIQKQIFKKEMKTRSGIWRDDWTVNVGLFLTDEHVPCPLRHSLKVLKDRKGRGCYIPQELRENH